MTTAELQQAKRDIAERCSKVAADLTPAGTEINYHKALTGRAWRWTISVPRPVTRKSLYIYLHEVAHIVFEHWRHKQPRHAQEMEAEKWAHAKMREYGIAVPRSMTKRAKEYVAYKITQAERRGAKHINAEAAAFARR